MMRTSPAVLLLFATLLAACSESAEDACGEPLYEGGASDEAYRTMVDAESRVTTDDSLAAAVVEPNEASTIAASAAPPSIRFTSGLTAMAPSTGRPSRHVLAKHNPSWSDLFIGTAWAHLPPVTGDIHNIELTLAGRECPVHILTTELNATIPASGWSEITAAAPATVKIEIVSAYLKENRITEGPFRATRPTTFEVRP